MTLAEFKGQIFTHADIVSGSTGGGDYVNGAVGVLGIELRCPDECPTSSDDYPAAPAGFEFGKGLITDGVEFVSLNHLCGEPAYIWS